MDQEAVDNLLRHVVDAFPDYDTTEIESQVLENATGPLDSPEFVVGFVAGLDQGIRCHREQGFVIKSRLLQRAIARLYYSLKEINELG